MNRLGIPSYVWALLLFVPACQGQEDFSTPESPLEFELPAAELVEHTLYASVPDEGTPEIRTVVSALDDKTVLWSGHGARDRVLKWADWDLDAESFRGILEAAQGNYRKMLAVMETCYSGSIGTYCEGLPGLLLLCAASSGETSHADVMEDGIFLSNRFTRVFRWEVEANPSISLHNLYYQLATHTTASHAGLYNDACYGNVYRNTMEEFLKPDTP